MKSLKYFALLALALTSIASCNDTTVDPDDPNGQENNENNNDYSEYEAQEIDVEASNEYVITFSISSAWAAMADVSWIQFKNENLGGSLFSSLTGQGGDDQSFTVSINDENQDFGSDQGKITLTLSDETQVVIAILTRQGIEPSISFTYLNYEDDSMPYEELSLDEVFMLSWNERTLSYAGKINFTANFPWRIEGLPDWISNSASSPIQTEGGADDTFDQLLSTSYENYLADDLMEATITVVCQTNSDISYSIDIAAQGATGLMSLIRTDGYYGFTFDADATYYSELYASRYSYYTFSCIVESNPSFNEPIAVTCSAEGIFSSESQIADWVTIAHAQEMVYDDTDTLVGSFDTSDTRYTYLTQFERWVSVSVNEYSDDRAAAIFVLPSSVAYSSITDLYDASTGEVKEEYASYIVGYVAQEGLITDVLLELYNTISSTTTVTTYQYPEDEAVATWYSAIYGVPTDAIFNVTFAENGGAQFKYPLGTSYSTGYTVDPNSSSWLGCECTDEYFTITMTSATESVSGYIILKNSDGENAVFIYCTQKAVKSSF